MKDVVTAAHCRIMSNYSSNLPTVLRFHKVLQSIATRVRENGVEEVESSLKRTVQEEPQQHGFHSASDIGLTLEVTISARFWIGQGMITPRFSSLQLDAALSAWRRLREARGTSRGKWAHPRQCPLFGGSRAPRVGRILQWTLVTASTKFRSIPSGTVRNETRSALQWSKPSFTRKSSSLTHRAAPLA